MKINLKAYYPFLSEECYIEVEKEIVEVLNFYSIKESSYRRKQRYHHAYFSLDREDGIERSILNKSIAPDQIYEQKIILHCLYEAIAILPKKQARRIYARFFLGMNNTDIAAIEGVSRAAVGDSIRRGLKMIEKRLKELRVWEE